MKKCIYCGAELDDNAKACNNCGRILPKTEPEDIRRDKSAEEHPAGKKSENTPQTIQDPWNTQDNPDRQGGIGGWGSQGGQNDRNGWGSPSVQNGMDGWGSPNRQNETGSWGGQSGAGGWNGQNGGSAGKNQKTNTFAVIAFIQGILALFLNAWLFFVPSVMAIVFGGISLSQLKKNPDQSGKGFAVAGLVLGIVALVLAIAMTVLAFYLINNNPEFSKMFQELYQQLEGGSSV